MILNISRASQFQECRQKAYNWHELGLMAWREAEALMTGEAFHVGIANLFATRNITQSVEMAEARYRERLQSQLILPEEQTLIEQQIELSKRAVRKYAEYYTTEPFQVLMPEVKFRVALPNTLHHCWYVHRLLFPNHPPEGCGEKACLHPHYLIGRTDAVIQWNNLIWLLEHKTTAMAGQIFYDRFRLDMQTTGYLYGIWKALDVRPHGFLLNVIKKPQKRAGADPFAITFEREPYVRDEESLLEFEREITMIANDYEHAFQVKHIYKNPKSCVNYNRQCYYLALCERHQEREEGEFRQRPPDYVDFEYYDLLGLQRPATEIVEREYNVNS
jgi:hypothetical protein